ncbi:MAG: hypothetical protein QM765_17785 [Myxococcales bacterium]
MPILQTDGHVLFANAQAFRESHKSFLSQGAILVSPQRRLQPFEKLELVLRVPGYQEIALKAEVTSFMGDDALLRFVPFDPELRVRLSQAANAALDPPAPRASPTAPMAFGPPAAGPGSSAAPMAFGPPAAGPGSPAAPMAFGPPTAGLGSSAAPLAFGPPAAGPGSAGAPMAFGPTVSVSGSGPEAATGAAPAAAPHAVQPLVPGSVPQTAVHSGQTQAGYRPSPTQTASRIAAALRPAGTFKNPTLPKEFLNLPLTRAPSDAELATPASICILMALFTRKAEVLAVHFKAKSGKDVEVYVVRGDFVASAVPVDSATKTLSEAEGAYEIKVLAAEPKVRNRNMAQAFGFALLKEYTKRYIDTEYADAMSGRQGQAPRMVGRGELLARSVGLSDVQLRVATRMLSGQYVLDDVLNSGVGARSTWQMVFLLQVLGGIEWGEAPPRQNLLVDEMQTTLTRIKVQDHFTAMGLHLSSSPQTIEKTYQRLMAQYGPGSYAHKLSPQTAEAIWSHMERCYDVISTPAGRKAYRASTFPDVRLDYAARLVYDQARLAEMRHEWVFALDQMNAVLELHPSREYLDELRRMQTASREVGRKA